MSLPIAAMPIKPRMNRGMITQTCSAEKKKSDPNRRFGLDQNGLKAMGVFLPEHCRMPTTKFAHRLPVLHSWQACHMIDLRDY